MKVHSNTLTYRDMLDATAVSGTSFTTIDLVGSRSRTKAYKFTLTGSSSRQQNRGPDKAATWDEWGIFLNRLFNADPEMHCGRGSYQSRAHFQWSTNYRFNELTRDIQHSQHKWGGYIQSVTHRYGLVECFGCGAVQRTMEYGHDFRELQLV